jgi:hypothetical protein
LIKFYRSGNAQILLTSNKCNRVNWCEEMTRINPTKFSLIKSLSCAAFLCLTSGGLASALRAETTRTGNVPNSNEILPKLEELGKEGKGAETTAQVTSVSQLSDVQPTEWAFTALQSLVERYGCIAGYPNGTFRGQRALSRYEFAAGLNACLDKINELISTGLADKVNKEDLAALQKLQSEFALELASLKVGSSSFLQPNWS